MNKELELMSENIEIEVADEPEELEDAREIIKERIDALTPNKYDDIRIMLGLTAKEEEPEEIRNYLNEERFVKYMKRKYRRKKRMEFFLYIFDTLLLCVKTMLLSLFILNTVVELTYIPSRSMVPTLEVGDIEVSSKLHYLFTEPERGDITIFYRDSDEKYEKLLTKRIIGLPGDVIEIKGETLYINGVIYNEPYLASDAGEPVAKFTVPEGQYFLLGDNRYESLDARYWEERFVSKENIIGKVIYIVKLPTREQSN